MVDFIFKIEAKRSQTGNFKRDVNVDFWGEPYELAAVFATLGKKNEAIKEAILYAADHLQNKNLRDEPRVKEGQQENNLLNFIYEPRS